jgi:hypothetical protein
MMAVEGSSSSLNKCQKSSSFLDQRRRRRWKERRRRKERSQSSPATLWPAFQRRDPSIL